MNSGQWSVASKKGMTTADMLYILHMNTPIPSKTGQPIAAVRFSDMQGKSHFMAICSCFCIPPQKRLPRLPPAGGALSFAFIPKRRAAAGEVSPGEAPEGPASPKGFTGWDGPGKSAADFSSGEQTVDGNSYPYCRDGLRCMTEKMQEVARSVPPGGAFQGGSLQGLCVQRYLSPAGVSGSNTGS